MFKNQRRLRKMKKIVSLFTVLFFLSAILITGCKKEEQAVSPQSPTAKTEQDVKFESFAKSLAKSLDDASNLSTLKNKISETFDGDYDVLYAQLRYNSLKSSSRLVQNIENNLSISSEELLNEVPLLNISVPHISDDANVKTLSASPWVVYVPENFQEGVTKYLIGFNAQGESKKFDAVTPPNEAVVVVGRNERVIAIEKGKKAALKGDKVADISGSSYDYFMIQPIDDGGSGSGGSNDNSGSGEQPTYRTKPYVVEMYMANLSQFEAWALGAPEINLEVIPISDPKAEEKYHHNSFAWKPNKRSDIDGKWWNCPDVLACNYNSYPFSEESNAIVFYWYEWDGGTQNVKISASYAGATVGFTLPIGSHNDEMCTWIIDKEDLHKNIEDISGGNFAWEFDWD